MKGACLVLFVAASVARAEAAPDGAWELSIRRPGWQPEVATGRLVLRAPGPSVGPAGLAARTVLLAAGLLTAVLSAPVLPALPGAVHLPSGCAGPVHLPPALPGAVHLAP